MPNLPQPAERISVAASTAYIYYSDYNSRVIFSFDVHTASFTRLNPLVPYMTHKILTLIPETGELALLTSNLLITLDNKTGSIASEQPVLVMHDL